MQIKPPPTHPERGQSMVEFAISAIVVIILLVAIADLGRAFFTYLALRDAAQEGALYASICPTNLDKIQDRARSSSTVPVDLRDETHVTIECTYLESGKTCGDGRPTVGSSIRVTVIYDNFELTTPLMGAIAGTQTFTIRGRVNDTVLRDTCFP